MSARHALVYEKDIVTKIYVQHIHKNGKVYKAPFLLIRLPLPVVPFEKMACKEVHVKIIVIADIQDKTIQS